MSGWDLGIPIFCMLIPVSIERTCTCAQSKYYPGAHGEALSWHFRIYSSLCLFLWSSETKGLSEDNKEFFRCKWLLSDIVVCRFPKWNQANDYKSKNYVFIKFDMKLWKQSVNREGEIQKESSKCSALIRFWTIKHLKD